MCGTAPTARYATTQTGPRTDNAFALSACTPSSQESPDSFAHAPTRVTPCIESLHPAAPQHGRRHSYQLRHATGYFDESVCSMCAPLWSLACSTVVTWIFLALAQSCISWWNGRDSLAFGCRTSQRTRPELLEQRGSSGHAVRDARALDMHAVALAPVCLRLASEALPGRVLTEFERWLMYILSVLLSTNPDPSYPSVELCAGRPGSVTVGTNVDKRAKTLRFVSPPRAPSPKRHTPCEAAGYRSRELVRKRREKAAQRHATV